MRKRSVHCLITGHNQGKNIEQVLKLFPELPNLLHIPDMDIVIDTTDGNIHEIKHLLVHKGIQLAIILETSEDPDTSHLNTASELPDNKSAEQTSTHNITRLIPQYSPDTTLLFLSSGNNNSSLSKTLSGTEICTLSYAGIKKNPAVLENLLHYAALKADFRHCKNLLYTAEERCKWLVDTTQEPIAYIHQGMHVYANPAYLTLFGYKSLAQLRSSPILDLIPEADKKLFSAIMKQHQKPPHINQSVLLTMLTIDNDSFRAGVRFIPAILKNVKCLQIWVHKQLEIDTTEISPIEIDQLENRKRKKPSQMESIPPSSPWYEKPQQEKEDVAVAKKQKISNVSDTIPTLKPAVLMQQLLQKNTSHVKIKRLYKSKKKILLDYYIICLKVSKKGQALAEKSLKNSGDEFAEIFWDKLLFIHLLKTLQTTGTNRVIYQLPVSTSSICNQQFIKWLAAGLKKIPIINYQLNLALTQTSCLRHPEQSMYFAKKIRNEACLITFDEFTPNKKSIKILTRLKPDYVKFSKQWLFNNLKSQEKTKSTIKLIKKLESLGIEVIATLEISHPYAKQLGVSYLDA
jgi:PAS domain-containing protein